MSRLYVIYHLARADFLERTRRYSFLIVLGLTIWAGYSFVPPVGANYAAMALGDYRGIYNSAWMGVMVAIMTSLLLTLGGFYLVNSAVERDERTRVGQIIASTPLSKPAYVFGKALSNFAVLAVVALAMQLIRGEDMRLNLWQLWSPFAFVALPALAVVAAAAVLVETIAWLRGGLANVSYFFVWVAVLVAGTILPSQGQNGPVQINDLFGINFPLAHMTAAARAAYPGYDGSVTIGFSATKEETLELRTFQWQGMPWTPGQLSGRVLWAGVAASLVLLSALFFNRFDAGSGRLRRVKLDTGGAQAEGGTETTSIRETKASLVSSSASSVTGLTSIPSRFNPISVLRAELRLLLKGQRWW
jgi:hypothetical protein